MTYDRDLLLERTDLRALADELLGDHKGRGAHANWPCPAPAHGPQTGRTPPVSIFTDRGGIERWHCHACRAGGTAVDLVMTIERVHVREALDFLATRAGINATPADQVRPRPRIRATQTVEVVPVGDGPAELVAYVDACEQFLWSPAGARWRRWLDDRLLPDAVLRANRVGADPGPSRLPRERGLPRRGPAVVFPVLGDSGQPGYLQARYLDADRAGRKYDNPTDALATLPRVALVQTPAASTRPGVLLVCEGLPDALSAAGAGCRAAAVLGAGLPDGALARRIVQLARRDHLILAFDADSRGQDGARRLHDELTPLSEKPVSVLRLREGDLNDWARHSASRFPAELHRHITALHHERTALAVAPSP